MLQVFYHTTIGFDKTLSIVSEFSVTVYQCASISLSSLLHLKGSLGCHASLRNESNRTYLLHVVVVAAHKDDELAVLLDEVIYPTVLASIDVVLAVCLYWHLDTSACSTHLYGSLLHIDILLLSAARSCLVVRYDKRWVI